MSQRLTRRGRAFVSGIASSFATRPRLATGLGLTAAVEIGVVVRALKFAAVRKWMRRFVKRMEGIGLDAAGVCLGAV
ncbi:MAG: hypothetical protein DMG96_05450 [Acidobacteria bacterium]|nr:MAG: hypothetical protein DMG96_05450 [Acidobacteriota bacterium]